MVRKRRGTQVSNVGAPVQTIKFSQMTAGGDISNNDLVPGLLSGENVLFNNPWTFLAPGPTSARPTPSTAINNRLRFNTDDFLYEYYDSSLGIWVQLQENAFTAGPFVIYSASSSLPDAFNLGSLSAGILKQTVNEGVATPQIAENGVDYWGPGFDGFLQNPAGVQDATGNTVVKFLTEGSASTDYIILSNGDSGIPPGISVDGADNNITLDIFSKGLAPVTLSTFLSTNAFSFFSGNSYQHQTNFSFANTANNVTATWQDSSGTVAWLSNIPAVAPSALSAVNDSNVTVALSGSPSIALLQTVAMTLGWSGQLSVPRGGSGLSSAMAFAPLCGGTTSTGAFQSVAGVGTNGQVLTSNGPSALPSFQSVPGGGTVSAGLVNQMTWYAANGTTVSGLTTIASGLLVTSAASVPSISTTLPNGLAMGIPASLTLTNATGLVPATGLSATGTPSASTYLRGDNTWSTEPTITPSALTSSNDTNVTITLGGTPATSLLQAVSLTMGWSGQLGLTRGGSGANLVASNGGIVFSTSSSMAILAGTSTAGQMLQSGSSTTPAWSTTTYPATNAINTLLYASAANTMTALAASANGVLISNNSNVPSWLANSGTPGFVLTANSALPPSWKAVSTSFSTPQFTGITSGTGTYTTPAGTFYLRVLMVGGGAGGSGSGSSPGTTTAGGNTTFGALTANGGAIASGTPGGGTIGVGNGIIYTGGRGAIGTLAVSSNGGQGGDSFFAGGACGGQGSPQAGASAAANSGSGGGGAGGTAGLSSAPGGSAAGALDVIITSSIPATWNYGIGAGGVGGTLGTGGAAGGNGGSGAIYIWAYFQ